jgi:hypothetical protein
VVVAGIRNTVTRSVVMRMALVTTIVRTILTKMEQRVAVTALPALPDRRRGFKV